ncbi:unnamed protein product [Darwinula stevensoni]|uniref:Anaphase-promoting complex subunit 4-like WD40 domain-containing protein n=1 Tax=Darwinula stevensoni TaxID=69355 RepID=A0A7R9A9N6_9CRUS|nr:unnamed protein product [Darwinula stevensoni]CAG0897460.1 unnamed protein product [Darwinula stevensoni]
MEEVFLHTTLAGHKKVVTCAAFRPDKKQLATGSLDHSIILWNFLDKKPALRYIGDSPVMDICFSPRGSLLVAGYQGCSICIWKPDIQGSYHQIKSAHSSVVRSVDFSPEGRYIASGSHDKSVKVWSAFSKQNFMFICSFTNHSHWVISVKWSHDGLRLFSCSEDKCINIYDFHAQACLHTVMEKEVPSCLALVPGSYCFGVGFVNGTVKIFDPQQKKLLQMYPSLLTEKVRGLCFHPSGKYLLAGSRDGCMKIIDVQEGQVIYVIETEHGSVNGVAFSPSGGYFASVGEQQKVIIWKFPGGSSFLGTSKETPNNDIKSRVSTLENQSSKGYISSQPELFDMTVMGTSSGPNPDVSLDDGMHGGDSLADQGALELLQLIANKVGVLEKKMKDICDKVNNMEERLSSVEEMQQIKNNMGERLSSMKISTSTGAVKMMQSEHVDGT